MSFDNSNIIHIHPLYIKLTNENKPKKEIDRLKYMLWSIGILVLKYIYNIFHENLMYLHQNYQKYLQLFQHFNIKQVHFEFFENCLNFKEENFSNFYLL